jgi:hypothetical protein
LAAAMVEVANTPASPVVTEGVPALASQIVTLVPSGNGPAGFTSAGAFTLSSLQQWSTAVSSGEIQGAPPYVVSAGQSLVITSIDLAESREERERHRDPGQLGGPQRAIQRRTAGKLVRNSVSPLFTGPHHHAISFFPRAGLQGSLFAEVHGYLTSN